MSNYTTNKKKILNDPIYGFINISHDIIFDVIEHPYFQRLRRIRQLGLTNLVYPAANQNRFQHALGAYHLMQNAIQVLRSKKHIITEEEEEGALIAILLHDIGHGPFSHALENTIIETLNHEDLSLMIMEALNMHFENKLYIAIEIFKGNYHKKFLSQLVSSQLDMDRLDYLKRDSFFTGVIEGSIGSDRIINMLDIHDDQLVIESKGIYSIEKYLIARRFMYWQVYLHKTVISAEYLLIKVLTRAKELSKKGQNIYTTPPLHYFLYSMPTNLNEHKNEIIENFVQLDDSDIIVCLKQWINNEDKILAKLSQMMTERILFKIEISNEPFDKEKINTLIKRAREIFNISESESNYFVFTGEVSNNTYYNWDEQIKILFKNGKMKDITEASDSLYLSSLSTDIKKYFLCYPKECIQHKL
jgi:HD superfamily phosphohydrolase